MELIDHRKLLHLAITIRDDDYTKKLCKSCKDDIFHGNMIRKSFTVAATVVTVFFFLCLILIIAKRYLSHRQRHRQRQSITPIETRESFILDEEQGPVTMVDHPIWYINTVGLPRSVIDSIGVVKFSKEIGFVDCSVCLSEFQEEESVRVLPKCDHAFHVACIDTWLGSHKNCPLCRAPIVCENPNQNKPEEEAEAEAELAEEESPENSAEEEDRTVEEEVAIIEVSKRHISSNSNGLNIYKQVMSMRSISMKRFASSSSSSFSSIITSKHRRTQSSIVPSSSSSSSS